MDTTSGLEGTAMHFQRHHNVIPIAVITGLGSCRAPRARDARFVSLLGAFRATGGVARARDIALQFPRNPECSLEDVEAWVRERRVVWLPWNETAWLALFQFPKWIYRPHPGIAAIQRELMSVLDEWDAAEWFCTPCGCLRDQVPIDLFVVDTQAVVAAARATRLALAG
jgi:hypothetical protein